MRAGAPRYGSDLIVDLLREAHIEHVSFNPGASFRGLHDSLVHAGDPAIVPCLHEAVSVAAAQGYAKATGRPMAVLLHDVVGLQNASMAIYNAWCDRVPMLLIGGTGPLSTVRRRPWIDWVHTASVQAEVVRHSVKWDDQPHDLASVPESFARALRTTSAEPRGPVYLCYDVDLQEAPLGEPESRAEPAALSSYPELGAASLSPDDARWLAELLAGAERPVLVAGYVGDRDEGFASLCALADLLGAGVVDTGSRCNLPSGHACNVTAVDGVLEEADVVVVLDVDDPEGVLANVRRVSQAPPTVVVGLGHLRARGWSHDYQSFPRAARSFTSSAASAAGALLAVFDATATPEQRRQWAARRAALATRTSKAREEWRRSAAGSAAPGAVPLDSVVAEVGAALDGTRFVLANGTNERLEHRLWNLDSPRQHCGWHSGGGLGYGLGASIGVALGVGPGVVTVDVQADGDALFTPAALWTMAHLSLPILVVVNNNRQYANSAEHAHRLAVARGRPADRIGVGTSLSAPSVDFAGLAQSFGVWATGPIDDKKRLADALGDAVAVVKSGKPALVDVLTPPYTP